jgi:hypothetical protein
MTIVNTAISIQDGLYQQATVLAAEMEISQDELFNRAIAEYLRRHQSQKLLQSLNETYEDGLDPDEQRMLEGMRRQQQHLVEQS